MRDIVDHTYPEDFFLLSRQIKLRKIDEYLINVNIAAAPTAEDRTFVEELVQTRRFMQYEDPDPQIDRAGLESLKSKLKTSPTIKVRQSK